MEITSHALLIVDVQKDFCPGGSLPVPEGDSVVTVLNSYCTIFTNNKLSVFASRDWHPANSTHFRSGGGIWPPHCIQDSPGAAFHPDLHLPPSTIIISKGTGVHDDGYSAFQGHDQFGRSLENIIEKLNIRRISIGGLATDYCVKWSVLGALERGLRVQLLLDAVRGVNLTPEDSERAIELMAAAGAVCVTMKTFSLV